MDKYKKVEKAKEATPFGTVRISATGRVGMYITYAASLFEGKKAVPAEGDKPAEAAVAALDKITIQATGNALPSAVQVVEILKRRIKGLHQTSSLSSTEITDEFEPTEKGLEKVTKTKTVSVMEIVLSKKALDKKHIGYQAPLPDDQVEELTAEELQERGARKSRPKGAKKPKSKGKGKGKGAKGKGKGKGKGEAAKPAKPAEEKKTRGRGGAGAKGAGKGSAKAEEKPARGRGKGRGRGK